jgi:hypothetical protein
MPKTFPISLKEMAETFSNLNREGYVGCNYSKQQFK